MQHFTITCLMYYIFYNNILFNVIFILLHNNYYRKYRIDIHYANLQIKYKDTIA